MIDTMSSEILVVGGAGYIGSHLVDCLQSSGFIPIVLDNLSTGHRKALKNAKLIIGDMNDSELLNSLFEEHNIIAIMHLASFIQVCESVVNPIKYYQNNVVCTLQLIEAALKWKVHNFIFSSSAAVYGNLRYTPVDEEHSINPINPYGQSKRMVEQMLEDVAQSSDFKFISLRYFNAAGAHPLGYLGEWHEPESHLIPLILQIAIGKRKSITVYGRDYPTHDGTCIRDYIHVSDLCHAHLLALNALLDGGKSRYYNLGTGKGFSVQEVIDAARKVTKKEILIEEGSRREGDSPILIANPNRAIKELNWHPQFSNIDTIIDHAWKALS